MIQLPKAEYSQKNKIKESRWWTGNIAIKIKFKIGLENNDKHQTSECKRRLYININIKRKILIHKKVIN